MARAGSDSRTAAVRDWDDPLDPAPPEDEERSGLLSALGLTLASALVWGTAHLATGRRVAGALLMTIFVLLAGSAAAAALGVQRELLQQAAVRPDWLIGVAVGIIVLAVFWASVVVRSYQIVRPNGLGPGSRIAGITAVAVLCATIATPLVWAAHFTQVYRDTLTSIFNADEPRSRAINRKDPWAGRPRVNILLLGGDAGPNRTGVRTDSMTMASVNTRTGDTVLISLPRNLENVPMPAGPALARFPAGFTGDGPLNPGLLNEIYEYGESHPEIVPGVPRGRRGPALLKATISRVLGQQIDYYVLVDMFGFADIIDAMGGVELTIPQAIPYGRQGQGLLPAGRRKLNGKDALWYGRSRTLSDDYTRMGRQKCLMRAIARQADPQRVVTSFRQLAQAAKRTISTDIPSALLPALVKVSAKVKQNAKINSLQFVPPLIYTGSPDYQLIRTLTARAIAQNGRPATPAASATPGTKPDRSRTAAPRGGAGAGPSSGRTAPGPTTGRSLPNAAGTGATARPSAPADAVSLDAVCPS